MKVRETVVYISMWMSQGSQGGWGYFRPTGTGGADGGWGVLTTQRVGTPASRAANRAGRLRRGTGAGRGGVVRRLVRPDSQGRMGTRTRRTGRTDRTVASDFR